MGVGVVNDNDISNVHFSHGVCDERRPSVRHENDNLFDRMLPYGITDSFADANDPRQIKNGLGSSVERIDRQQPHFGGANLIEKFVLPRQAEDRIFRGHLRKL